jgi:hypothetical protein
MSDEKKTETPAAEGIPPETPQANWEYKEKFKIHEDMKEVVNLTISASQMELKHLRRKLEKLTYGS